MLQPRVKEEVTYVSNCLGLSCIICAASLFRGSSGLGSCNHTALQLSLSGQHLASYPTCSALLWPPTAGSSKCRHPDRGQHVTPSQVYWNFFWLWVAAAGTSRCRQPRFEFVLTLTAIILAQMLSRGAAAQLA